MSEIVPIEGDLIPNDGEFLSEKPYEIKDSVDPLDIIKTTQSIRLEMVKKSLKRGVPDIGEDSRDFTQLLRDLDSAALTTRKIDVEEQQASESQRLANAQDELMKMLGGANPFAIEIGSGPQTPRTERSSREDLPTPKLVPDITAQGTQPVNYDDFVKSVEESERAMREDEE